MGRPSNPNNRYDLKCKVTGNVVKTNPKQFRKLQEKYNVLATELDTSYVTQKGRKILREENLSVNEAVAKYGLNPNVAAKIKGLTQDVNTTTHVEVDAENVQTEETVAVAETSAVPTEQENVEVAA